MVLNFRFPDIPDPACSEHDPDLWFPEAGQSPIRAKTICAECAGLRECRAYAMAHPGLYGIWGGMTTRERTVVRERRRQWLTTK